MDLLLQVFVMVLCKKIPTECDVKKIEKLHEKVRLLKPPSTPQIKKPESAVLRITTPKDVD